MSKREGQEILAAAKKAGRAYADESVNSDSFMDYVHSQILDADIDDLPETKKEALRGARNMLTDLYNDSSRQMRHHDILRQAGASHIFSAYGAGYVERRYGIDDSDVVDAFWEGFNLVIDRKTVQSWLADEILFRANERRDIERT